MDRSPSTRVVLGRDPILVTDEVCVAAWVDMVHDRISA